MGTAVAPGAQNSKRAKGPKQLRGLGSQTGATETVVGARVVNGRYVGPQRQRAPGSSRCPSPARP
eukprot:10304433-Alexandrium_andersonii.AAC.1